MGSPTENKEADLSSSTTSTTSSTSSTTSSTSTTSSPSIVYSESSADTTESKRKPNNYAPSCLDGLIYHCFCIHDYFSYAVCCIPKYLLRKNNE